MSPWRLTMPLFIVWTVAMAAWLLLYRGADATCGPEIYRNCTIGVKVTTGLGRPGIVLLWSLGVVALGMTWLTTRRPRPEAVPRAAVGRTGTSAASVAAGRKHLPRPVPANVRGGAMPAALVVGQRFRDSEEYRVLAPYVDQDGLVAGYRIDGLLSSDPWRHTTYEASSPDGRPVALKLLPLRRGGDRREARSFRRRVRARAAIQHPHLLPIFDWGRLDDRLYVAMGLCKAPTLADLLEAGPLDTKDCLRLLGQLADALESAHERGMIHRELAPENVLVAPHGGGHVWLGDFGVASRALAGGLLDLTGPTAYMAPERLMDEPLTPASNVYSLACILVECLTGSPPFTSDLPGMVGYAHASEPPPRVSARRSDLPLAIDDLVAAAMAKDPDERPESARWMVAATAASLGLGSASPPAESAREGWKTNGSSATATSDDRAVQPRRATGPWPAALPRSALALVVVVAGSGALGLTLGRLGDDRTRTDRTPAVRPAERERTAALRATDGALERLDIRRASAHRRLATARTRRAQADAATGLVSAYGAAARAVPTEFRETAQIASTLNEASQAYRRLVAAAHQGSRRRYAIAGREVRRRERDLQQAIARLNKARR